MEKRVAAERRHAKNVAEILAGDDLGKLKQCVIDLWDDWTAKKKSCDEKARRLALVKKRQQQLEVVEQTSELLNIDVENSLKRLRVPESMPVQEDVLPQKKIRREVEAKRSKHDKKKK